MVQTSSKIPTLNLYPYNRVVVVLAKLPRACAADHAQAGSVIVNPVGNLDELCAVICRENDLCGRIDRQGSFALGHRNVAAESISVELVRANDICVLRTTLQESVRPRIVLTTKKASQYGDDGDCLCPTRPIRRIHKIIIPRFVCQLQLRRLHRWHIQIQYTGTFMSRLLQWSVLDRKSVV